MNIDVRRENFEHIELFGKPALFTQDRLDRDTMPKGWHCYHLRGSDCDFGKPVTVERKVTVNYAGAVLMHDPIFIPNGGCTSVEDNLNFLGEQIGLREFCHRHNIPITEQELHFEVVGRVSYANGETFEFTDAAKFLKEMQEELPDHRTTGFRFETITSDPQVRKAVADLVYDLFGEANPHPVEDYELNPEQDESEEVCEMTFC